MQGVGPNPGAGQAVQGEGVEGGAAPLPEGPPLAMGDLSGFAALPAGVGLLGGGVGGVPLPGDLAGAGGMAGRRPGPDAGSAENCNFEFFLENPRFMFRWSFWNLRRVSWSSAAIP